jgi:hypothetical protein
MSNYRIPSYQLMYEIIQKFQPNVNIPRIIQDKPKHIIGFDVDDDFKHNYAKNHIDLHIKMIESPYIDDILVGLKGIARNEYNNYDKSSIYLPYITNILDISKLYINPRSDYEADVFAISISIIGKILYNSYKKEILNKEKCNCINEAAKKLIDNFKWTEPECKRVCSKTLDLLGKITFDCE